MILIPLFNFIRSCIKLIFYILGKKKTVPLSPLAKQQIVKEYAKDFSIRILVETGTCSGSMVEATRCVFDKIYSIELDKDLYNRAKKKFLKFDYITIIQGDSGKKIPLVIEKISDPCLFWLDAHYSKGITAKGDKETPIMEELRHIFCHSIKDNVILIDDARLFVGKNDYPPLIKLKKFILKKCPNCVFEVKDDIIRIHKKISG